MRRHLLFNYAMFKEITGKRNIIYSLSISIAFLYRSGAWNSGYIRGSCRRPSTPLYGSGMWHLNWFLHCHCEITKNITTVSVDINNVLFISKHKVWDVDCVDFVGNPRNGNPAPSISLSRTKQGTSWGVEICWLSISSRQNYVYIWFLWRCVTFIFPS